MKAFVLLVSLFLLLCQHLGANSLWPLLQLSQSSALKNYNNNVPDSSQTEHRRTFFPQKMCKLSTNLRAKVSSLWCKPSTPQPAISIINQETNRNNFHPKQSPLEKTLHAAAKFLSNHHLLKHSATKKKKLLILMSDTGGGHRASAQAIDQAIQEQFPGKIEVEIMDIWTKHAGWPYNKFVPVYRYLAKHPLLWRGFFAYGTFPLTRKLTEVASWRNSYQYFQAAIEKSDPDFVVSVHPLCQLMPITIVQDLNRRLRIPQKKPLIPFVTVVTDLGGAHNTWFDPRVDALFVPSEAVRQLALRNRVAPHKILLKGLPIRPAFWKDAPPKLQMRRKLKIAEDSRTVLLMGGGDGVGGLDTIATHLATQLQSLAALSTELVVVCGHNRLLEDTLRHRLKTEVCRDVCRDVSSTSADSSSSSRSVSTSHKSAANLKPLASPSHRVTVKGFVQNIDEYMAAADLLITKAGPGTIAEAMARGLPMLLSSFLPGQEAGNVPLVVQGGFGLFTGNNPKKIAATVTHLFQHPETLQQMSRRARAAARPEATQAIARDIAECMLHDCVATPASMSTTPLLSTLSPATTQT